VFRDVPFPVIEAKGVVSIGLVQDSDDYPWPRSICGAFVVATWKTWADQHGPHLYGPHNSLVVDKVCQYAAQDECLASSRLSFFPSSTVAVRPVSVCHSDLLGPDVLRTVHSVPNIHKVEGVSLVIAILLKVCSRTVELLAALPADP
jgi:hypothetical protein